MIDVTLYHQCYDQFAEYYSRVCAIVKVVNDFDLYARVRERSGPSNE
jgi:hypothetical protein